MSQRKRHAVLTCGFVSKLDKPVMLKPLAPLRGGALRGSALGRAIVICSLAITIGFAGSEKIDTAEADSFKPFNTMNLKLYLHNQINDWNEFECANELGQRESSWRYWAVNKQSGAYGIFQHMSKYAPTWSPFEQIDKHIEYINARYDGSWCAALAKLKADGWH
jgi:hypothetical protein